jgi:hypothetical protein
MPWELIGNAGTDPANDFLGTTDEQPLVIRTNNAQRVSITPDGNVGIGTSTPQRKLHVESSEIHSGGSLAGFSFGNRLEQETGQPAPFTENPANGERWVWYADGVQARLWSGADMITVGRVTGDVNIRQGNLTIAAGSVDAQEAVVGDRANFANDVNAGGNVSAGGNVNVQGDVNVQGNGNVNVARGNVLLASNPLRVPPARLGVDGDVAVIGTISSGTIAGPLGARVGVFGRSGSNDGVSGTSTSGVGVGASSTDGTGVDGHSTNGIGGVFYGGKAQLKLQPSGTAGRPATGQHTKGELFMDSAGVLFVCTADGAPGTWRRFRTDPAR